MLRRLCVALTLGILMLAALAQGAAADPINAKNNLMFPATCRRADDPGRRQRQRGLVACPRRAEHSGVHPAGL